MACVVSFSSDKRVPGGILDHSTLDTLWPATFHDPVTGKTRVLVCKPEVRRFLLKFMHRFELALPLKNADGSPQEKSIVPAMLKCWRDPERHDVQWREFSATHLVLGMSAVLDFVPHNLVPQLLVRTYQYAPAGNTEVGIFTVHMYISKPPIQ